MSTKKETYSLPLYAFDGSVTYEEVPIVDHIKTADGSSIPMLDLKMMSDEKWLELVAEQQAKQGKPSPCPAEQIEQGKEDKRIIDALNRVSPEDAYIMAGNSSATDYKLANKYAEYGYQIALRKGWSAEEAQRFSHLLVWVAGRALISGRRPNKKAVDAHWLEPINSIEKDRKACMT